ncbi:hypothetical protein Hanom_Chr02g00175331 [Helianthus anomalus]
MFTITTITYQLNITKLNLFNLNDNRTWLNTSNNTLRINSRSLRQILSTEYINHRLRFRFTKRKHKPLRLIRYLQSTQQSIRYSQIIIHNPRKRP